MKKNKIFCVYFIIQLNMTITVLSRVRQFLPEMEKADLDLSQRLAGGQSSQQLDIESVDDGEPCIEMVSGVLVKSYRSGLQRML